MPAMTEGKLHGFQLWVNMPAKLKMSKPEYIYIDSKQMQVHKDSDKKIKTIAGKFGDDGGPVKGKNVEPIYFDIELEQNKEFNVDIQCTHKYVVYLIEGERKVGEKNNKKINGCNEIRWKKVRKIKLNEKNKTKVI